MRVCLCTLLFGCCLLPLLLTAQQPAPALRSSKTGCCDRNDLSRNMGCGPEYGNEEMRSKVENAVTRILDVTGLSRNFELIECSGFGSCQSVCHDNKPAIAYDPGFLNDMILKVQPASGQDTDGNMSGAREDWGLLIVLAHETGHILNQHLMMDLHAPEEWRRVELEADRFTGVVMCQLGASLQSIREFYARFEKEETPSRPGMTARLAELERGWRSAGCALK